MLEEYEILKDMEEFEKRLFERQTELVHIHEAGHVIAARHCRLKIVSADIHARGKQCGLTRVEPMSAMYSISKGVPLNKAEALIGFNRHNFELLAGAAAQALYCFEHNVKTLNGFTSIQPEIYGILLEFSKDDGFTDFAEEKLTHGMGFFLTETGASGDWSTLLQQFKALPYDYFEEFSTHEKRIDYLHQYWGGSLELLRERWDEVMKVADALRCETELSGDQIESILG